jgi:ABC-type transport system involved in multi-copper enzyme maturation permease subunit
MSQFGALLRDSYRQSLDRKILIVLLLLAVVPVIFCFGISFESEPLELRIAEMARGLNQFRFQLGLAHTSTSHGVAFEVGPVRAVQDGDGWPEDVRSGHAFDLRFESANGVDELARSWRRLEDERANWGRPRGDRSTKPRGRRAGSSPPEAPDEDGAEDGAEDSPPRGARGVEVPPLSTAERVGFLEDRFRALGFDRVRVRAEPPSPGDSGAEAPAAFRIAVAAGRLLEVSGSHKLRLLFGAFEIPLEDVSVAAFVVQLQLGLSDVFIGFIVMLIALSTTGGFVPDMVQKGTLDLILARPIGRTRLLLYKYVGGLWFVGLVAVFLVGGCWLGLALRTGFTSPWFLFSIVTLLATFAVLYSVSVLLGVLTRSAGLASLAAIGVWGASSVVVGLRHSIHAMFGRDEVPALLDTAIRVAYAILPKTKDLSLLNTYMVSRANLSESAYGREIALAVPDVDWVYSIGTTGLFTAAMLGIAVWFFRRKDY